MACDLGVSRGPTICMLWLVRSGKFPATTPEIILSSFAYMYPDHAPGQGILQHVMTNWTSYLPPSKDAPAQAA